MRYEVHIAAHGRPLIERGPMAGCYGYPTWKWAKLTPRPLGLKRAIALADEQMGRASVLVWGTAETVYQTLAEPLLPYRWQKAPRSE